MTLNWKNGLPKWLEDDSCELQIRHTSNWCESKHAVVSTARPDKQIVTVVYERTFSPRCWAHDEETIGEGWSIYISHELIDEGEGNARVAEIALEWILKEQKLTIEE